MRAQSQKSMVALSAIVAACQVAGVTPDVGADRPVVIQAVMVADQAVQSLSILWAPTRELPTPIGGPPATSVHLWIVSEAGDSVAVVATTEPGLFTATLTPTRGSTYRLVGSILDSTIQAHTTLPRELHVESPASEDTVAISMLGPYSIIRIDARVTSDGSPAFIVSGRVLPDRQSNPLVIGIVEKPSGPYGFDATAPADGFIFQVVGLDSNAALFYRSPLKTSTIQGALGLFGSELADSVQLVVRN